MNIETKIKENVELAPYTTFKIGGKARYFIVVQNQSELSAVIEWAEEKSIQYKILAGGSNVLISDNGYDGIIIKLDNNNYSIHGERIECGAAVLLSKAVSLATSSSLSGLEWAIGIPGTVGGAIRGNAGAFRSEIAEAIETVEVYDKTKKRFYLYSQKDCEFEYRNSIFKKNNSLIIWQVALRLRKGNSENIGELINLNLNKRNSNQPKLPSAGCVFKNVFTDENPGIKEHIVKLAEEEGMLFQNKIPAGWIIDKLDLRGQKVGGAKVSLEHANFIINTDKAKAEDIITLISIIKEKARNNFGIQLENEIEIV